MTDYQVELQMRSDDLNKLQDELRSNIVARQQLESQQKENKMVQKEFGCLADDATIYKLIGPALVKQDKAEATLAVDQRLEFIQKEVYAHAPYHAFQEPMCPWQIHSPT
ncbi:MAG: hypothetical protein M1815_005367 [Lichina confinis]|nr:MAG: hypothetical protein M1815_005367 [Lichina confinis]